MARFCAIQNAHLMPTVQSLNKSFAARLAKEGFVTYSPQNPYIGKDHFRIIQRKAHPLKLSLFSFILGQHQRLLEVTANNTPAMIYQFTIDKNQQWKWLYISEGVRKIMGVSPEDLYENPQKGIQDVHPGDLPSVFINLEKACKTGSPFSWYGRLQRPGQPNFVNK